MDTISEIAKFAAKGDLASINKLLTEEGARGYRVADGRAAARRDPPLAPLNYDPIKWLREQGIGWSFNRPQA
jgi:hypothetical protein